MPNPGLVGAHLIRQRSASSADGERRRRGCYNHMREDEQGRNALSRGSGSSDLQAALRGDFPFRTEFSLAPLIEFWTRAGAVAFPACAAIARLVGQPVARAPDLKGSTPHH